jgi:NADH dehydrogenase
MNLIVGSTGHLGSEICRQLLTAGKPVRAMVRASSDPGTAKRLEDDGAEIVQGDLRARESLSGACQGCTAVISTASSLPNAYVPGENDFETVDRGGAIDLVDAAVGAGISQFVYTSFSGQIEADFPFGNAKRAVEEHLKRSGLAYTILRPTFFMESWLSPALGFDYPNAKAQIYGSGQNPISWVSSKNVAQFAVESLGSPAAQDAVLELGGPEALSPLDVVAIFEEASGYAFQVDHVPQEVLWAQFEAATDPLQKTYACMMWGCSVDNVIDMQETLSRFPMQLTSVQDYARRVLG